MVKPRATRWIRARAQVTTLVICLAVVAGAGPAVALGATPARPQHVPPNIVLIQSDDQTFAQLNPSVMPNAERRLVSKGATFTDYIATTAQCCPSRASLITGQYPHNHGVTSNAVGYRRLKGKYDVLPVWLRRAGYRTMHVGAKYMNGYESFVHREPVVPPGWSDWFTSLSEIHYYDYELGANGQLRKYGHRPSDYITRVLGTHAGRLIKRYAPKGRPFYLQLDERAPHVSLQDDPFGSCDRKALPDPRDEGRFRDTPLPDPPSFNEQDMSDKPSFLRAAPPIGPELQQLLRHDWDCALASLSGVDRNVEQVFKAVKRSGELSNTVFIYVSDNGRFAGEHRIPGGKVFPYEEAIHLPLVIRVPKRYRDGVTYPLTITRPVGNIDLAPTMLALAGAKPCGNGQCRTMDGRSLLPLLGGSDTWPPERAMLTEYNAPNFAKYSTCRFAGIRTGRGIYVEHYRIAPRHRTCITANPPQVERYDLTSDPFELDNLCFGGSPSNCPGDPVQFDLERRLAELRRCAGVEGRDHRVTGRPFCE